MTDDGSGAIWLIIVALAVFGVLLPILLSKTSALKKAADKLPQTDGYDLRPRKMKLVRCDCGADTQCPQGRNARAVGGNPYRCQIWKAE